MSTTGQPMPCICTHTTGNPACPEHGLSTGESVPSGPQPPTPTGIPEERRTEIAWTDCPVCGERHQMSCPAPDPSHVIVGLRTLAGEDGHRGMVWETCTKAAEIIQQLESENYSLLRGQQALRDQTVRIRRALGVREGAEGDTEDYAREAEARLALLTQERSRLLACEQVLLALHTDLGIKWGDDPYAAVAELRKDRERTLEELAASCDEAVATERETWEDDLRLAPNSHSAGLCLGAIEAYRACAEVIRQRLRAARSAPLGDTAP